MKSTVAFSEALEPVSVLVVAPRMQDILFAVRPLSTAHFEITVAETFLQAKALIASRPPALLITEIRLGEYNGLHLVLRGKGTRPDMGAVVTSSVADAVIQAEAERLDATFLQTPTTEAELIAAVLRTLSRRSGSTPIRPPFERRTNERRTTADSLAGSVERRTQDRRRKLQLLPHRAADR
jgi:two-component system, response regulator RegA